MMRIRRALVFSTGQRYVGMVINFATIVIVSRILTPSEIGVAAAATAILSIAYSVREFATADFLVAQKELTHVHVRTAFTVMLLLTTAISAIVFVSATLVAAIYHEDGLSLYLKLAAASFLLQVVVLPLAAILRREMLFDKVAIIEMTNATVTAAVTISLASLGFSYMSFAWELLSGAGASAFLALYLRPNFWIFRPLLHEWRVVIRFGGYHGTNVVFHQLFESFPALLIGRLISFDALGLYNRALNVSMLPHRVLFGGVVPVILPAFSAQARERQNLCAAYLKAVEYTTGLEWPALVVLSILAYPLVFILLGTQWVAVAPLVQIIAVGLTFSFAFELNYPLLQAIGALRDILLRALIVWPLSGAIIAAAIYFGLKAVAFSYLITIPLQALVAFHFVRRHMGFGWHELFGSMKKSAIVTMCSAAGPLAVVAQSGFHFEITISRAMIAAALSVISWIGGLWITKHPLFTEIRNIAVAMRHFVNKLVLFSRRLP